MNKHIGRKGFTLIETLVATMLLAISLAVILQLFSGGLRSSRASQDYTRAIFLAEEKMEEILLKRVWTEETLEGEFEGGSKWTVQIVYVEPEVADETEPPQEISGIPLNVKELLDTLNSKEILDLYRVDIKVYWNEGLSEKHFTLSTLVAAEKNEQDLL